MSYLILFLLFTCDYALSERSFTLVLDTTVSMADEISTIKASIGQVVQSIDRNNFGNFVLVPFQDTPIEPALITQSAQEFTTHLNYLTTSGGYDCPENSLTGIEAALRASGKHSSIFVFTDAYSKDHTKFRTVESLCRDTHSQVIIFLSGFCYPARNGPLGSLNVYYDIAKACSGAVFRFNSTVDLRQAFRYMKEIMNTEWTRVNPYEKFNDYHQLSISVDSFTTDLMIAVSGSHPNLGVLGLRSQNIRMESIVETRNSLVIRLRQPDAGEYTVTIHGLGPIAVTVYERSDVPFQFGFSTKSPRSIAETSPRPLSGYTNYLLINVDSSIKLRVVEWLNLGDSVKQILYLKQNPSGSYVSSVFVETGKMFQFWIIGEETSSQYEIKGSSRLLSPQMPVNTNELKSLPEANILDSDLGLVDFGTELTLACKVMAYPIPEVYWTENDDLNNLPSETILLEIPSVYISYVTLNVTKNTTVNCNGKNSEGMVSKSIDVFVNRTLYLNIIQRPEDASVEYGTKYSLHCKVDAYPEATLKWYLNGSIIESSEDSEDTRLSFIDNALLINNMDFEDIGSYECVATNGVVSETMAASIEISGVETPEIDSSETEKILKIGDWLEIECSVIKGKPQPQITWKFKSSEGSDFSSLPEDVSTEESKIKISSVEGSHGGIYKCFASNVMGEDTREFIVRIQSPPVIKNSEQETVVVREGLDVDLPCDVESSPAATVRWEMSQDDVSVNFDHRHRTDEKNTHHFQALWKDSGNYHCVAENSVGRAERTVFVNVLVPPYIETPKSNTTHANIGQDVDFTCNVVFGNPAPTIRWQFIAKDSVSRTLTRDTSSSTLRLIKVSRSDEGSYMCIAENRLDSDSFTFHLIVH